MLADSLSDADPPTFSMAVALLLHYSAVEAQHGLSAIKYFVSIFEVFYGTESHKVPYHKNINIT